MRAPFGVAFSTPGQRQILAPRKEHCKATFPRMRGFRAFHDSAKVPVPVSLSIVYTPGKPTR